MEHDLAFHTALARASRNPVYSLLIGSFQGITRQTWPIGWKSRPTQASRDLMIATHAEIAEAVAASDPQKATMAMSLHFDESVRALLTAGLS
jgi:DNA-binding FadR family transcriptional regulator